MDCNIEDSDKVPVLGVRKCLKEGGSYEGTLAEREIHQDLNHSKVSMSEVRKCLQEAGSYDGTMSEREMREIYQVLNDSKNTASEEDEHRRILEETERNCKFVEEMRRNSVPVGTAKERNRIISKTDSDVSTSSGDMFEDNTKTSTPKQPSALKISQLKKSDEEEVSSTVVPTKPTLHNQKKEAVEDKYDIDVFNSIPTTHKPLKLIPFKPMYNPPLYCNPKMANMGHEQKAQLIAQHHLTLLQKYVSYQRQSIFPAPWGKPIHTSSRFNGNLLRKIEKLPEDNDADTQMLVHKIQEDKNSDEEFEMYVSQSGRQTKRKLYVEDVDNNNEPKKSKTLNDNCQWIKKQQTKKRSASSKNEDIIKRSKLFADTPATRSDKLFDKLQEDESKKKAAEKEMEKFHETLVQLSDEENVDSVNDVAELIHSEEPFIRRRIVPPSRLKKQSDATKQVGTGNKPSSRGRGRKPIHKKSQEDSSQKSDVQKYIPLKTSTADKNESKEETGTCPMCNKEFPQGELLQHASECEDSYSENSIKPTSKFPNKLTCENCDLVLPLNMDYEVHVLECLRKSKRSLSSAF